MNTDKIHYHCTVKACDKTAEATCSTMDLDGAAVTCNAPEDNSSPSRRKRSSDTGSEILNAERVDVEQVPYTRCTWFVQSIKYIY